MSYLKLRLELNGEKLFLDLVGREQLAHRMFEWLAGVCRVFILNDSGESFGFGETLSRFDVSEDKEVGEFWTFTLSDESRPIILRLFEKLENAPHVKWGFTGEDLQVRYSECGDENSGEAEGVVECWVITANGSVLAKVRSFFMI